MTATKADVRHRWDPNYAQARALQDELRDRVATRPLLVRSISAVAGADVAISDKHRRLVAAVVVLAFPSLEILETRSVVRPLRFPYIPGLLSFREIPALIACFQTVRSRFDVILCDGHGVAHPRRFGLASHLGVVLGIPTVGCAKSRLVGEHDDPADNRGAYTPLYHGGRIVGSVLRTREGVKPLFVSRGHLSDLAGARRVVLSCLTRYRLPEPTRLADIAAARAKRERLAG